MAKKQITNTNPTFNQYKAFINETYKPKLLKNAEYYLKQFSFFTDLSSAMPCAIYLLDYTTQGYIFVSDGCQNITGYTAKECINWTQQEYIKRFLHKDDAEIFTTQFFEKYVEIIKKISNDDIKNCRFSLNYRLIKKDGSIIKILQQSVVLETNDLGYPVLSLGILIDITAHKIDNQMVFSVSHFNAKTGFKTISSDSFTMELDNLTIREKEITKHIVYGHNTAKIADILFISPFTVKAHRRNILEKTKCKNIAELINYAINNGIG
jgi:DNA-binding CsgD family transcriptional regulator